MKIIKSLKNTNLVFSIFIVLGFLIPDYARDLKILLIPALITMMSFSLIKFKIKELDLKDFKSALILVGLNSFLFTAVHFVLAFLFIDNILYRNAVIILGLMPPAVGIISLIYLVDADMNTGFIAELIGYILSLIIIPVFTLMFFGEVVTLSKIFQIIVLVILTPFFISRIILYFRLNERIIPEDTTEIVVNLCYGLLFYIAIGVNIDVFFDNITGLIHLIFIFIFLRFGMFFIIYFLFRKRFPPAMIKLLTLFGSFKNGSAGMAITVLLFGIKAAVPYAIFSIVASFFIIFLKWFLSMEQLN